VSNANGSLADQLKEAERKLFKHSGYRQWVKYSALHQTITAVFIPNWNELLALLEQASADQQLAIELVQNVHRPDVRDRFQALTVQRLHNYVAGTMTLVDHVRRISDYVKDVIADFEQRKVALVNHPEVPFVQDLRNYTLHHSLPLVAHRLSMSAVNTPAQQMESEVELSVGELLRWKKWSASSKAYLANQDEVVGLRPLVRTHGDLVVKFNMHVYQELARANEPALQEANELVIARNALLVDGDRAAGVRLTNERTERASRPGPGIHL
jgi:hypothetical protein